MSDRRWDVEVKPGVFHDVGMRYMDVDASGALVFRRGIAEPISLAYAPGTWLSVTLQEDEQ